VKSTSNPLRGRYLRPAAVSAIGLALAAACATAVTAVARPDYPLASNSPQACAWRTTPSSDPHPSLYDRFDSIAALSPRDAWAVGDYFSGREGGRHGAFIERWNGRRWRVVAAPIPRGAILWSVSASGARDAWALGQTDNGGQLIEHWDGRRWTIVPSPNVRSSRGVINNFLFAISGSRRDDVWAVGSWGSVPVGYGGRGDHALALHWDGRSWSRSPTPAVAQRSLFLGVVTRGGQAWAVGDRGLQPHQHTLIERWDGAHWSVVPSPAGFSLAAVTTSSGGTVWTVGASGRRPLAARC
jgi:hypothetical protein